MSDRTTVQLIIHKQNRELVLNKFDLLEFYNEFPVEGKDGLVEVTISEANYAGWDHLKELATEMDFVGSHEAGSTYGSFVFCSVGTSEILDLETGYEGGFVIHVIKTPCGEFLCDTASIQEYSRQYKLFTGAEPF